MPSQALVWFKRDLRLTDHAPLAAAAGCDAAAGLFVIEPEWLSSDEFDAQHLEFLLACLAPLRAELTTKGLPLLLRVGTVPAVLAELRREFDFSHLYSHEETGPLWTYARDRAVAGWCRTQGVAWQQWPQTGVVRALKSRSGWAARWAQRMGQTPAPVPGGWRGAALPLTDLPTLQQLGVQQQHRALPAAGENAAQHALTTFLAGGARGYRRALSSPLTAESGCSRLSAHLAFGTLAMRTVHQRSELAIADAQAAGDKALAYGLRGFTSRLRWHCHFMQKLEDQPEIEQRNFARVYDGLRAGDGLAFSAEDTQRLDAWCAGATGYPMVDACMRSLRATGWLNFRMRAMLVSFASYHLWLHWRHTGLFLARQFLDFEPGIHWSQMQMQSGTTGINTLRIYSPAKQAAEHDPDGSFIRRWVPEVGSSRYPAPIVNEREALKHAKDTMYGLRKSAEARTEADEVQARHGSRKSGLPQSGVAPRQQKREPKASKEAAPPSMQLDLFS